MTTFAESITTLLSTYDNCLALLKSFKHHRQATSGGASDPDAASVVAAQTRLRRSIRSDRTRISRAYEARLSQSGTLLKKGDARARSCLRRVMRRLSAALTRVLRTATGSPEPVIDYESLASLSNASRIDAIKAIDGLSRRISDSGGLAQKAQQQPAKARTAKSHSSLKSDWSSARSQASSSQSTSGRDKTAHHKTKKKDKEGRATLQKERVKERDGEKEKEKEKLKKGKHRGAKSHAHKKGYAQHHNQHFLPEDPRNQTWDEREYREAVAESGEMDESFHDHYYTTAPPPPPPPKSPPPPPHPDAKAAASAHARAAPVPIHATVPLPVSITVVEPEPTAPEDVPPPPPPHSPPLSPQATLRPGSPRSRTTPTSPKRISIASFTSDVTKLGEIVRQSGLDTVVDEEFEIQPVYPLRPYAPPAPARKKGFWSRLAGRS